MRRGWVPVVGLLVAVAGGSCSMSVVESPAPDETPAVSIEFVSTEPAPRFPKSFWTFNVRLENRSDVARWFLIPNPPEKHLSLERGADGIDVVMLDGQVPMLRIWATHNLLVVRLGPGAEVQIASLRLTSWDENPLTSIEIWASRDLLLDSMPLGREHLGGDAVLVAETTEVDATQEERVHGWADPKMAAHFLAYQPDERWVLAIAQESIDR